MLNRYIIAVAFVFFLALFSFLMFWNFDSGENSGNEKEIVWVEKPSFILLKDLKSSNPVLRREAITKLGEKRVKRAIKPLFEVLMSENYPLRAKQRAAKSLSLIAGNTLVPKVLRILEDSLNKKQDEISSKVILSMLYILKSIDLDKYEIKEYNFRVLEDLLQKSDSNEILLNTIQAIENIGVLKGLHSFRNLKKVYYRNLFHKVAVLKAMTRMALQDEELARHFEKFLDRISIREAHDSVQRMIREGYFTVSFKRKPSQRERQVIGLISDLRSKSMKKVLSAERQLISMEYKSGDQKLAAFFLNDYHPLTVNRLMRILLKKNLVFGLEEKLKELVKNRYNAKKVYKAITLDTAKKALLALSKISISEQQVNFILGHVQDYFLGNSALLAVAELYSRGIERELIQKKLKYFRASSLKQKYFLFAFLDYLLKENNPGKIEKVFYRSDYYNRFNALNIFLKKYQGKKLPGYIERYKKYREPVIKSMFKHYGYEEQSQGA